MNLNYSPKAFSQLTHNEHSKKSAIHKAGHGVLGTMERLWEASHNRSIAASTSKFMRTWQHTPVSTDAHVLQWQAAWLQAHHRA